MRPQQSYGEPQDDSYRHQTEQHKNTPHAVLPSDAPTLSGLCSEAKARKGLGEG